MYQRWFNTALIVGGFLVIVALFRVLDAITPDPVVDMDTVRPADMALTYQADPYAASVAQRFGIIGGYAAPTLTVTVGLQDGSPPLHVVDVHLSRMDAPDLLMASTPDERQDWLEAVLSDARARWPGDRIMVSLYSAMWLPDRPYDGACSVVADVRDGIGWQQTQYYAVAWWPDPIDQYSDGVIHCTHPD